MPVTRTAAAEAAARAMLLAVTVPESATGPVTGTVTVLAGVRVTVAVSVRRAESEPGPDSEAPSHPAGRAGTGTVMVTHLGPQVGGRRPVS